MKKGWKKFGVAALGALATCLAGAALAAPQRAEVVLGIAVQKDAANVVFLVAEKEGIYKQCGLDVSIIHFSGGGALMPALASGKVNFGWAGTQTPVGAREQGAPIKTIAEVNRTVQGWGLVVPKDSKIKSLKDLFPGVRISFTSEGSFTQWFALYAMAQAGLKPGQLVGAPLGGSVPVIRSAMEKGNTDAAIVLLPWGQILEKDGFRWVAKFWETFPELNFTGLHVNEKFLASNRNAAERMVGAYVKTVKWMKDNRAATEAFIADFYGLDKGLSSQVYDMVIPDYNPTGEFKSERMQHLIDRSASIPGFIKGSVSAKDMLDQVKPSGC